VSAKDASGVGAEGKTAFLLLLHMRTVWMVSYSTVASQIEFIGDLLDSRGVRTMIIT